MNRDVIVSILKEISLIMCEKREYLIDLDSVVGDGDLGLTMSDGFVAAYEEAKASSETDLGKLLYGAGKKMSTAVPSTMGTLMASGLMQAGKVMKGKTDVENDGLVAIFQAYLDGVANRGKAKVGEKTFLDGLAPAVTAMSAVVEAGGSVAEVAAAGKNGALAGFQNTTTMIAVHGRAATRGEASRSLEDPGAAVAYLLMVAFEKAVANSVI